MMQEEETEQSYSEKGMDMLHGPLLKKFSFLRCRLQSVAFSQKKIKNKVLSICYHRKYLVVAAGYHNCIVFPCQMPVIFLRSASHKFYMHWNFHLVSSTRM